jgi:hypothetical protein
VEVKVEELIPLGVAESVAIFVALPVSVSDLEGVAEGKPLLNGDTVALGVGGAHAVLGAPPSITRTTL